MNYGPSIKVVSKPGRLEVRVRDTAARGGWRVLSRWAAFDTTGAAQAAQAARRTLLEGETP